eukprot:TRINITY_DN5639_c0_g1_i3.p1 TRINITY_DN5639_c0_g1~~TRINITY_DN5639_c0_g1_i3.p1  ORF type:complete len:193 (-),score=38.48 TRINITY_DN5639_c0_g1_i3:99-677(-)
MDQKQESGSPRSPTFRSGKIRIPRSSTLPGKCYIRAGDSLSLWNFSSSPGWSPEESQVLRLAIMKYGLGNWANLLSKNVIPGKTRGQLTLQTQRLCGQQSLGEFMGLHIDVQKIWERNQHLTDVKRKSGMIINEGNNPTKESRLQKIEYNREKYGLSQEEIDSVVIPTLSHRFLKVENENKSQRLLAYEAFH